MNVLLIGSGAREHAIARAIKKSTIQNNLFCFASNLNPGIEQLSTVIEIGNINNQKIVKNFAVENSIDIAIVGPEAPLANGVVDALLEKNIPCVGPIKHLAQLETSKGFTRDLMNKYNISGLPRYKNFSNVEGVETFINELDNNYVVKFDGLMGGKGVKVAGEHLNSQQEALDYCNEIISNGGKFVIEEKLLGEEFSLMSFCDGDHLIHMPPVQDHKRAYENDTGPNTGGMGSYNDANQSLPFLNDNEIKAAQSINVSIAKALKDEFGIGYKGILYGGFMITAEGVKVIEYNARLGDPEAMNVLELLESDLLEICLAITKGELDQHSAKFSNKATVCKYAVPTGYPDAPVKGKPIDISKVENVNHLYFASVDINKDFLIEAGSRTIAVVGIADTVVEAEKIVQEEIERIEGPLFHRKDIGTSKLIQKRIDHMKGLRGQS